MAVDFGAGPEDRSVDVSLNVVPFIDLMTCLTAFLLVTAVWSSLAQLPVERDGRAVVGDDPPELPRVAALITPQEIFVGHSHGVQHRIALRDGRHDWDAMEETLRDLRSDPLLAPVRAIQIAAEDAVIYQGIVTAIDVALAADFPKVGVVDPPSLAVAFLR